MANFKQKIHILCTLILSFSFLISQNVLASIDKLEVEFEKTPLFSEANFVPGEGVNRWIKVKNNETTSHKIIVEAINKSDPDGLSDQLYLIIKENSNIYYNGTLKGFFEAGEYGLSDLSGNGEATQYDFSVTFIPTTGNDYQGKTLSFDFLVGFQGQESNPPSNPGGGGGGGGGGGISGLTILDESVTAMLSDQCQATVYWSTTYFSTSQVVFSSDSEPHNFDINAINYGYSHSQEGDNSGQAKVIGHQITLYGLTPGVTYYYRAISHASPASVSRQYSFVMCPCSQEKINPIVEIPLKTQTNEPLTFNNNSPISPEVLGESTTTSSLPLFQLENNVVYPSFLANISNFFNKGFQCLGCLPWWIGIILILLAIQKIIWLFRKAKKAGFVWIFIGSICLIVTLIFYLTKICFYWWLIIIFFALHILIYQFLVPSKDEQKRKINYFVLTQVIVLILAIIWAVFSWCLPVWLIFLILAIIFVNNKK